MSIISRSFAVLVLSTVGFSAFADSFTYIKESKSAKDYEYSVSYPAFNKDAFPSYFKVNADIKSQVVDNACTEEDVPENNVGFYYEVDAKVEAESSHHVTVRVTSGDYCGGAHPNNSVYFLTYSTATGDRLKIGDEFGLYDYGSPNYDETKNQAQVAKLVDILLEKIPANVPAEETCFTADKKENREMMEMLYPYVAGLGDNKTVILSVSPAHVAMACYFDVAVPLSEVKHLLNKGSYLASWLK